MEEQGRLRSNPPIGPVLLASFGYWRFSGPLLRAWRQIAPYSHGVFSDSLLQDRLTAPLDLNIWHQSGKSETFLNMT